MKYIIIILTVLFAGCIANNVKPEFKPLPPKKLHDLFLREDLKNIVYKSPTPKDYIIKEYN